MYGQTSKRHSGQIVYEPRLTPWHAGNGGHGGSSFVPMLSETPSERATACKLLSRGGVRTTRGMHEVARPPTQTTVERVVRAGSHVKTRYWLLACFYSWG